MLRRRPPTTSSRVTSRASSTLGSAGDVHPVIALALALQARGHRTTILTNEFYGDQIRTAGIGFLPLGTIRVASTLKEMSSDSALVRRCKEFAAHIDSDAALAKACAPIEALAPHPN